MSEEIKNRVAESKLVVFDLEDYFPNEKIIGIDLSEWLDNGLVLRETQFRDYLKNHEWEQYKNTRCFLYCSTDAVMPAWAYLLVTQYLNPFAIQITQRNKHQIILEYYIQKLLSLDYTIYKNKPVIIKGCTKKPVPAEVYVFAMQKLLPFAQSIMFGEACSAVPLHKLKK